MVTKEEAKEFASRWLPAWTGNKPEELAVFYSDDAFFLDPGQPQGVKGKDNVIAYFRKMLGQNPKWVWTVVEPIPMEGGFLYKLQARIPVGKKTVECIGLCFVQFDDQGKIRRNEIYFDRTELIAEINKYRQSMAH